MESIVNKNESILFHCAVGTDRTGTVAYLVEGILGVSNNQRFDDFELSYFYREESGNGLTRTSNGTIKALYDRIDKFEGKVIAVYHRFNDVEDKWIVSLDGFDYSDDEILQLIHFQEQYYEGELLR